MAEGVSSCSNLCGDKDGKELLTIFRMLVLYILKVTFKLSISPFHIKICNPFIKKN